MIDGYCCRKEDREIEDGPECSICLEVMSGNKTEIGLVKSCSHIFHFECLWDWLCLKQTCPMCRENTKPRCDSKHLSSWLITSGFISMRFMYEIIPFCHGGTNFVPRFVVL